MTLVLGKVTLGGKGVYIASLSVKLHTQPELKNYTTKASFQETREVGQVKD